MSDIPSPPPVPKPPPIPDIPKPPPVPKIPTPPPIPPLPAIPNIPVPPPIPSIPAPPAMPAMPNIPTPPPMPAMPQVPGMPKMPAMPSLPKLPAMPSLPKLPGMPAAVAAPSVPGAPKIPGPAAAAKPPASPASAPAGPKPVAAAAAAGAANGQAPKNSKPEKAKLILKSPEGANPTIAEIKFQFNPKELSITKKASWKREGTNAAPDTTMPQFTASDPRTMSLDIFMDAVEDDKRNLVKDIENLFSCCKALPDTINKSQPSPPFVLFAWGETVHFSAYVQSVTVKMTMFSPEGKPLRATASVALEEIPKQLKAQNPTSGALATQRTHQVIEGDNLQSIAYREYGSPAMWRAVAEANRIDDPLRLRTGITLLLPPPDEAAEVV
jgi:nucleoid-associated protein YgaU